MAKKSISTSQSATQMVGDINDNFTELYQGAGGGSSSTPTEQVDYYVLSTGNGSKSLDIDLKAGDKITCYGHGLSGIWSNTNQTRRWYYYEMSSVVVNGGGPTIFKGKSDFTGATSFTVVTEKSASLQGVEFTLEQDASGITGRYGVWVIKVVRNTSTDNVRTNLYNKRWLLIGDSISSEESGYAGRGYGHMVAEKNHMRCENISIGGRKVFDYYNIIDTSFKSVWGDYDIITVMLGTNDVANLSAIDKESRTGIYKTINNSIYKGFVDDEETTMADNPNTLYVNCYITRLQLFYERLRSLWPNAMIVFLTPIKRVIDGSLQTNLLENGVGSIEKVAAYYRVPHINLYNTIDPTNLEVTEKCFLSYTGADKTHPNTVGHALYIAPTVERGLIDAVNYYNTDYPHFDEGKTPSLGYLPNSSTPSVAVNGTVTLYITGVALTDNVVVTSSSGVTVDRHIITKEAATVTTKLVVTGVSAGSETVALTSGELTTTIPVTVTSA